MSGAMIASAVIMAGATIYSAEKQKDAQKDMMKEQQRLAEEAKEHEKLMRKNVSSEPVTATAKFGSSDEEESSSTGFDEFISSGGTKKTGLQTGGGTGLGFGV